MVGDLHLLSYAGEDCLLGLPDHAGIIQPTELFHRLLADAIRIGPVSITIDTLTDVYAGDEIDRNQTTQFVKLLQHMAIKARCSVAILAHPSNAGMATGSGLSGSTGWHNKVRSRLYMRSPTTAKGEEIDSDVREIQFLKNNYGRQGDSIPIRWENGVFVPESAPCLIRKNRARPRRRAPLPRPVGKVRRPGTQIEPQGRRQGLRPRPKRTVSVSNGSSRQWSAYLSEGKFT
jgi:RecA-family ATPase